MKWLLRNNAMVVVLLCFLSVGGTAQQGVPQPSSNPDLHQENEVANLPTPLPQATDLPAGVSSEPRIGSGDLLKISVLGSSDFDQEVRVGGEGNIYVALLGKVAVGGLTTEQAGALVRKQLIEGGFFADPQVSVFQKEYATQGISVLGEVQKPGVYPVLGPRRLFDALSLAGGTTPKAGRAVSVTRREQPTSAKVVTLSKNVSPTMEANIEVFPGDTVVVSKAGVVYVVGAVRLPTGIVMENSDGITVLQALAVAGGTIPTAALNGTKIIRKSPDGPKELPIKLKLLLAAKSSDVSLEPEDIVFVPQSAGKKAGAVAVDTIVHMAASMAAYSVF